MTQNLKKPNEWMEALHWHYFWSRFLSHMFASKGKYELAYYLTMKEFEKEGIPPTDESLRDWHNIGIVARVAYEVTKI